MATNYIINFTDPLKGSFNIRAYTTNGLKFPIAPSSSFSSTAVAASTTLLLYGKGHPDYGERTAENFVHLLENFSGATEPTVKLQGLIWHKEVLYFRDTSASPASYYFWDSSVSPGWVSRSVTEVSSLPASAGDGDYYFNTSTNTLYRYSDDERNIAEFIPREFESGTSLPSTPTREMMVWSGTDWQTVVTTGTGSGLDTTYLRLDTTNDPLTGDLSIRKSSPKFQLIDTAYTGSPLTSTIELDGSIDSPSLTLTGLNPVLNITATSIFGSPINAPSIKLTNDSLYWTIEGGITSLELKSNANDGIKIIDTGLLVQQGVSAALYSLAVSTYATGQVIPNRQYVDSEIAMVSGAVGSIEDNYVASTTPYGSPIQTGGSPLPLGVVASKFSNGVLTLATTTGHPDSPSFDISGFDSENIPFVAGTIGGIPATTVDDALTELETQKASLSGADFTGEVTGITPINPSDFAIKSYVDSTLSSAGGGALARSIQTSSAGPDFQLPFKYVAGENRLQVYVNGIKKYLDQVGFDIALFNPSIVDSSSTSSLLTYTIVGWTGHSWKITGNHVSEFSTGDIIRVDSNTGLGVSTYYSVTAPPTGINSPILITEIPVVKIASPIPSIGSPLGSPLGSPIGVETPDGILGINYDFAVNWGGSPSVIYTVNGLDVSDYSELATEMTNAFNGTGVADIVGGNLRIQVSTLPGVAGTAFFETSAPSTSTAFLFGSVNLGETGFTNFLNGGASGPSAIYDCFEASGGSPNIRAIPGTYSNYISFNSPLSGSPEDIIEFILI